MDEYRLPDSYDPYRLIYQRKMKLRGKLGQACCLTVVRLCYKPLSYCSDFSLDFFAGVPKRYVKPKYTILESRLLTTF